MTHEHPWGRLLVGLWEEAIDFNSNDAFDITCQEFVTPPNKTLQHAATGCNLVLLMHCKIAIARIFHHAPFLVRFCFSVLPRKTTSRGSSVRSWSPRRVPIRGYHLSRTCKQLAMRAGVFTPADIFSTANLITYPDTKKTHCKYVY